MIPRHAGRSTWRAARILVLGLLAAGGAFAAEVDPWDAADAKWRQGPVKYLLTKEEDQAYRKLKTNEERAAFVTEFWGRRDPTPGTPENEYRVEFYRRSRDAASRFTEDGGRGWQDDRGRVFILLGPPDDTREGTSLLGSEDRGAPSGLEGSPPPGGGGFEPLGGSRQETSAKTLTFVYLTDPFSGKTQRLEISFVSEVTGGYRLQDKIDWNNPLLKGLSHVARPARPAVPAPAGTPDPAAAAAQAAQAAPPSAPVEATPESDLMAQVKESAGAAAAIPLDVTTNFYKASDASTFATLTLEVKKAALPEGSDPAALIIAAEVVDPDTGESVQRFFRKEHFGPYEGNSAAAAGDTLLFQAERPMRPGRYRALFALKDPASGLVGKLERDLEVPNYDGEALTLSTVTLARKIQHLAAPPAAEGVTPFVLGNFTVVPRPDNVYAPGEDLTFYYQIYGAATDPGGSAPRVDLSYAFEKRIGEQWRMVGGRPVTTPGQTALVQAYSLPLTRWPGGDYRVTLRVTDTVSGRAATAEVPFTIQGTAPVASKAKAKSKS